MISCYTAFVDILIKYCQETKTSVENIDKYKQVPLWWRLLASWRRALLGGSHQYSVTQSGNQITQTRPIVSNFSQGKVHTNFKKHWSVWKHEIYTRVWRTWAFSSQRAPSIMRPLTYAPCTSNYYCKPQSKTVYSKHFPHVVAFWVQHTNKSNLVDTYCENALISLWKLHFLITTFCCALTFQVLTSLFSPGTPLASEKRVISVVFMVLSRAHSLRRAVVWWHGKTWGKWISLFGQAAINL